MRILLGLLVYVGTAVMVYADAYYPDQIEAALRQESGQAPAQPANVVPASELPPPQPAQPAQPAEPQFERRGEVILMPDMGTDTPSERGPVEVPTRAIYGVPDVSPPEGLDTSAEWRDDVPQLQMTDVRVHTMEADPPVRTVGVWRVMAAGLGRGFANVALGPGEMVRGFTYEYTARPWYYAIGTSWLAALGGSLSRMGAGLGDIITAGYFGDTKIAEGYPDYVWQGDWTAPPQGLDRDAMSDAELAALEHNAALQAARDEQDSQIIEVETVTVELDEQEQVAAPADAE